MDHAAEGRDRADEIAALFSRTFTDSEGADEGRLIGDLARALVADTPEADRYVFTARDDGALAGCIVFSRLTYPQDARTVFVLAPVAVATGRQGQGIGQALLRFGLAEMRRNGAEVAMTYGDPAYYGKVGFRPITEADAAAPFPLSIPHGWLAQSLTDRPLDRLMGPSSCVPALADPAYW